MRLCKRDARFWRSASTIRRPPVGGEKKRAMGKQRNGMHGYARIIIKNVLGWLLILSSFVIGPLIPGPGGIPVFLIGFALVAFPGKRRLTARVLRGKRLVETRGYEVAVWLITLLLPAGLVLGLGWQARVEIWMAQNGWHPNLARLVGFVGLVIVVYGVLRMIPLGLNLLLRMMPRIRKKARPSLRRLGIRVLPPRWAKRHGNLRNRIEHAEQEIVVFHESFKHHMHDLWRKVRPIIPKLIGVVVVPLIFYRLFKPIFEHWEDIQPHLASIRWDLLGIAAVMFALNQAFCRLPSWAVVLKGLGWRLPRAPAARIWVSSELARYVPGFVWQVLGRAMLSKPYGLPGTTSTISQVLELTIYLLANIIVALTGLSVAGAVLHEDAQQAVMFTWAIFPVLLGFLHPRIFYPVVNMVLRRIGKPTIERQLSGKRLVALLALAIAGQLWLGLAMWLGTQSILQVRLQDFWLLAGSYSMAWVAGFCAAAIAPGGIGVREFVLSATLYWVIPTELRDSLSPTATKALFAAVAVLLRLWATAGELLFAGFAYAWDWPGVKGHITQMATKVPSREEALCQSDSEG